jgi:hypothetical protein
VNPRVFLIALVVGVAVLGGGWWFVQRSRSPEAVVEAPRPAEARKPPPALTPKSEPVREAPATARSASPAREEAPAAEAAAPAAPTKGTLHVTSDVPDALVFLDRTYAGKAPVTIPDILPGPHKVNVSAEGLEGVARDVDIVAGAQDVEIRLREVRLKASLAVVHKHRIGACSGQLTATLQGIRYDTTNKEDGFAIGLSDMEQFEVDYLAKTLKLKVRGGKAYSFSDPDGNIERVFAFHRDVDKARARLAKGDTPAS